MALHVDDDDDNANSYIASNRGVKGDVRLWSATSERRWPSA